MEKRVKYGSLYKIYRAIMAALQPEQRGRNLEERRQNE